MVSCHSGRQFFFVDEPTAKNGAAILPVISDQLLLLSMRRPAQHREPTLEVPRGCGEEAETALDCAVRELREETGYDLEPDKLDPLGHIRPNTGLLTSRVAVFLASIEDATHTFERDDESRDLVTIPLRDLSAKLAAGESKMVLPCRRFAC